MPHPLVEDRPEGLDPDLVHAGSPARAGGTKPARLNQRDSCCGLLSRWSARSRSGSQNARRADGGHWSRGHVEDLLQPLDQPGGARLLGRRRTTGLERRRGSPRSRRRARTARGRRGRPRCPVTGPAGAGCAGRPAELDLEPPAAVVGPRLAPELDRADLGDPRRQADRHPLGLRLAADAHQALERRQLADRVGVGGDQVARPVVGPDRAARQREGDRLAHQQVEVVAGDRDLLAFLGVAGDDAEPGLVGRLGLEADVERPGRAAADPDAAAAADDPVIRRALGDGQVERGDWSGRGARRRRRGRRRTSERDDLDDAVADDVGRQGAAVEEDRVGPRRAVLGLVPRRLDRLGPVPAEEVAEVPRDGRVGHERQAELLEAELAPRARAPRRGRPSGRSRRATIDSTSSRVSSDWMLPPMIREPRPAIVTGQRSSAGCCSPSSFSLAVRQANRRALHCSVSSRAPPSFFSTWCASARSMLSPPSIRWSPTATRRNPGPVGVSTTVIRLKSVVPPPMSQTRISSPARTSRCQPSLCETIQQ